MRNQEDVICHKCQSKFNKIQSQKDDNIISLYEYNDAMKEYLHQFKFLQDVALAKVFYREIYKALSKEKGVIVPIPMHPKKIRERTFAHVDCLIQEAHIPFVHVLEKTTETSQSSKTKKEREESSSLFKIKQGVTIQPQTYILVDDIVTTGTTLRHAREVLLTAGAASVHAVTLIRG